MLNRYGERCQVCSLVQVLGRSPTTNRITTPFTVWLEVQVENGGCISWDLSSLWTLTAKRERTDNWGPVKVGTLISSHSTGLPQFNITNGSIVRGFTS